MLSKLGTPPTAVHVGVKADPPTIFVEYYAHIASKEECTQQHHTTTASTHRLPSTAARLRRKTVRLRTLASCPVDSDVSHAHMLARKFPGHFGDKVVNDAQLVGLITKLRLLVSKRSSRGTDDADGCCGDGPRGDTSGTNYKSNYSNTTIENDDAAPSISAAQRGSRREDLVGENSNLPFVGPEVRPDREVGRPGPIATGWGGGDCKESDARYESHENVSFAASGQPSGLVLDGTRNGLLLSDGRTTAAPAGGGGRNSLESSEERVLPDQEDLNRVSESDLAAAKSRMDVAFQQNLRKPGSPGYVYDLRKNFVDANEECDWDQDSSSGSGDYSPT